MLRCARELLRARRHLFNLPGIHMIDVGWRGEDDRDRLLLIVETGPAQAGWIQRDTASVAAVARRLGADVHTLWDTIRPLLQVPAEDPARYQNVRVLGVDGHIWHHAPRPGKGPRELTGMV